LVPTLKETAKHQQFTAKTPSEDLVFIGKLKPPWHLEIIRLFEAIPTTYISTTYIPPLAG
jgi:hypothetical protein